MKHRGHLSSELFTPLRADRFFRIEKIPSTVSAAFNDKSIVAYRLITDDLRRSSGRPKHHKRRIHRIDTRPQGGPRVKDRSITCQAGVQPPTTYLAEGPRLPSADHLSTAHPTTSSRC